MSLRLTTAIVHGSRRLDLSKPIKIIRLSSILIQIGDNGFTTRQGRTCFEINTPISCENCIIGVLQKLLFSPLLCRTYSPHSKVTKRLMDVACKHCWNYNCITNFSKTRCQKGLILLDRRTARLHFFPFSKNTSQTVWNVVRLFLHAYTLKCTGKSVGRRVQG